MIGSQLPTITSDCDPGLLYTIAVLWPKERWRWCETTHFLSSTNIHDFFSVRFNILNSRAPVDNLDSQVFIFITLFI